MGAVYLQPGEYAAYGVASATAAQVAQASATIDGYLKRPKGLIWTPDSNGTPAYMAGAVAEMSWTNTGPIAIGQNVVVAITGAMLYQELIGRPVVLEAGSENACEVCIISGLSVAAKTITLANVQFAHQAGIAIQGGLQIFEERSVPNNRPIARVGQWPISGIVSALGRYDYGRRSDRFTGDYRDFDLLSVLQAVGGPPTFVSIDVAQMGVNPITGELWIPAGVLLAYFSTVRVFYVAGWQLADLPTQIKQACANIVGNLSAGPLLGNPSLKAVSMVGISIQRFAQTMVDDDTKGLLDPFKARLLG